MSVRGRATLCFALLITSCTNEPRTVPGPVEPDPNQEWGPVEPALAAQLEAALEAARAEQDLPGLAMAVAYRDSKQLWVRRRVTRRRGRLLRLLGGRAGLLDADGHVDIAGVPHRLASPTDLPAGPVIAMTRDQRSQYRMASTISGLDLVGGTHAEHRARFSVAMAAHQAVALVTALQLALPLIATAAIGMLR